MKSSKLVASVLILLVLALPATSMAEPAKADSCTACKSELYGLNSLWTVCPVCGKPLDPGLKTLIAIRTLATCAGAYAVDHRAYPQSADVAALAGVFQPEYVKVMPLKDGWNGDLGYRATAAGDHYVLGSRGSNGLWERPLEDYLSAAGTGRPTLPPGSDDVVLLDGAIISGSNPSGK
jgi:hypothetical protein